MGTSIRAAISKRNGHYVEKHRYYELKHFCRQYPLWRNECAALDSLAGIPDGPLLAKGGMASDPTARCAVAREFYLRRIGMVERAARETDEALAVYILKAVTLGRSYDYLRTNLGIPCGKEAYYKLYRRFFRLLDEERG